MVDANRKYLQNVISGNMNFYGKNIKAVKVPHIEQLSIKDLINWGIKCTDIALYLKPTNTLTENDSVMFHIYWIRKAFKSQQNSLQEREKI